MKTQNIIENNLNQIRQKEKHMPASRPGYKPVLASKAASNKFIHTNVVAKSRRAPNFSNLDKSPYTEMYTNNSNANKLLQNKGDKSTPKNCGR